MVKDESEDPFLERETQKYQTPIPSREHILSVLEKTPTALKRRAFVKLFALENSEELQEALRRRLNAMVRDGQILKTPQGYIPLLNIETCQGRLVMDRDWEGSVRTQEGKVVYISGPSLRGCYEGDEVEVQVNEVDAKGDSRGRIIKLLQAITPLVIGRLIKSHHHYEVLPFDRKFTQNITIPKEMKAQAKNGDIVQVKIVREEKYNFHAEPVGEVIEVLGDLSTPGIEVKMALRKFNLPHEWPKEVLKECEKFTQAAISQEKDRQDLTELGLVTIDGEDAKDFDDAVFCQKQSNGGWQLWVAIADVSHYVRPGTALDKEAYNRGNSTYFPGSVIPMLPHALSNELCSLKPNVPRLCIVCEMSIDNKGNIKRSKFYRAIMHSKARLTYTEVAEIIRGNVALQEQYQPLLPSLHALHELYHAFHGQRKERGAIDFDTVETRILFDQNGKIKNIVPQVRNIAHKMIEESMLAANVCAAKFIHSHKRGTLYRIHDRPPKEKINALREFLSKLGLDLPGRQSPTAKDFSHLIAQIEGREDRHVIETVMLRSLSQAQYSPANIGHFGLAYPYYLHFTSPIRRYPDLMVHRTIIEILASKWYKKSITKGLDFEKLGTHCSETERRSDEATRDAVMALKCHYMQDKVGQEFRGIVSGVANFGLFVELKDVYIEGLVHVTALGNEYFTFDAANHRMVGERTRTAYRLGDALEVKVMRVDVEAKKIDLELLHSPRVAKTHTNNANKRNPRSRKPKKSNDG